MAFAAIILAAGSSSRMGQSKQMLDIHGRSLLVRTIEAVIGADVKRVVVVLGADEKAHHELIANLPVEVVVNPDWENGMGSSLKKGLQHVRSKHPSSKAVIVSVCDQPLLKTENITNLIERHRESRKPIIASGYSKVPAVPALFHKSYFENLAALADDQGAKKIILENPSDVLVVPFPGGEIDLDTMADYQRFRDREAG